MEKIYDTIIVGSGPAGMTAAVYASRAGMDTLILDHDAPGGKMVKTLEIQNWPGIVEVEGPTLAYEMFNHSTSYGATFDGAKITGIETDADNIHTITSEDGRTFVGRSIIVATGTQERTFDTPLVQKYEGRGISFCAICDGAFHKEKEVVVFGGGNSALDEANYLTQFASKVYVIHRRDEFTADKLTLEATMKNEKIELITGATIVDAIEEDNKFAGVTIKFADDSEQTISASGMFIYIGANPRSELLEGKVELTPQKYIIVNEKMETSAPGIYAAGDVIDKILRQVVTATNDGAIAAQEAFHYVDKNFGK